MSVCGPRLSTSCRAMSRQCLECTVAPPPSSQRPSRTQSCHACLQFRSFHTTALIVGARDAASGDSDVRSSLLASAITWPVLVER
jgi:hypothetical protein